MSKPVFAMKMDDIHESYDDCASGEFAETYRTYNESNASNKDKFDAIYPTYRRDRLAQKVIEKPVFDALSNWRDIKGGYAEIDKQLELSLVVQDAVKWSRLLGYSVVLPILKNSEGKIIPANQDLDGAIARNDKLVIDKVVNYYEHVSFSEEIENDPYKRWFKKPKKITLGNRVVHPSRCVVFGDIDYSVFDSIAAHLSDYYEAKRRIQIAVRTNRAFVLETDFSAVQQFIQSKRQATGQEADLDEITQARARALYNNLNDANLAVINAGEKVHNFQANNIGDLVKHREQEQRELSGVSGISYSALFGKSSSSMSSDAQADFENTNQELDGMKSDQVDPYVVDLDRLIGKVSGHEVSRDTWKWNPTKSEETRLRLAGELGNTSE